MYVRVLTFSRIAAFLVVLFSGLPILSEAGVFWSEDFENHLTPNWDTSACNGVVPGPPNGCNGSISTDVAHSGTHSFKGDYTGPYSGPVGPGQYGNKGTYYDRGFPASAEVWTRFYYYTVPTFTYSSTTSKHFYLLDINDNSLETFWMNQYGSRELSASTVTNNQNVYCPSTNRLDVNCNWFANAASVPLNDGVWYCIETRINAGTAGQADGLLDIYINGTHTLGYTGVPMKLGNQLYNNFRIYVQDGTGLMYYDDLAVGNTRIGCSGSPSTTDTTPTDTTPPAPPTGLTLR